MSKHLSAVENQCERLLTHLSGQRRMIDDLQHAVNEVGRKIDHFLRKDSIEEKLFQKQDLTVGTETKLMEKWIMFLVQIWQKQCSTINERTDEIYRRLITSSCRVLVSTLVEPNVFILQIKQRYKNCLTDWRTLPCENERLGKEFDDIESKLKTTNVKIDGQSIDEKSSQIKKDFELLGSQLLTMERFGLDLSQHTQEIDLIEHFQTFHRRFQRSKILWKDLLGKTTENQLKFDNCIARSFD